MKICNCHIQFAGVFAYGMSLVTLLLILSACSPNIDQTDRIRPWSEDNRYWQYKGEPVLLLGGADQDNPFNHPGLPPNGLESHLDLLVSVGGNYIRNTMTSRDLKTDDLEFFRDRNYYPFYRDSETGLFDLERFKDEYWTRFRSFMDMTLERDIIVQIEIWDRVDFGRDHTDYPAHGWSAQPYNPKNNINYTAAESRLPEIVDTHPGQRENPFFRTTPAQEDNPLVLRYQEKFVEKLLSITLEYPNVLYCISNETNESEYWSGYWARFILDRAEEMGVDAYITEMWDAHYLTDPMHRHTFDHPDLYAYVDISQNNHQSGQTHWDNMQMARELVADPIRPMNNVKVYGGQRHGGGIEEGMQKFWRNIIGGMASARFHRPGTERGFYGAGLGPLAQTNLRSARKFSEALDIFRAEPRQDLLRNRKDNEAYITVISGEQYAIYFPDGGSVDLDLSNTKGDFQLRWMNIGKSEWTGETIVTGGNYIEIMSPGEGQWALILLRK
jgi:hypothetical protein